MFQKYVYLLVNFVVLCHSATEPTNDEVKGGFMHVYPNNAYPCGRKPLPRPPNPFITWDTATIGKDWWSYITKAKNNLAFFKQFPRDEDCEEPWMPEDGIIKELDHAANPVESKKIRYYWQPSCPYRASWLGSFTWKIPRTNYIEKCYLLWPCCQKVRIVRCATSLCNTKTHCVNSTNVKIANSVCCETNFRKHKDVYVFCLVTRWLVNGKWIPVNCKINPERCLKLVTISVPQCCECWSCRGYHHHHISTVENKPPLKVPSKARIGNGRN